ncbi:MAG TPA: formyltransferase family protein, partial [Gaiellaceae bacterium]|nr:formyltransferase family protein [Gaiellaceae bacterium]
MIGVLVSGEGTNLQALLDAGLPVVAVASNVSGVGALERARAVDVPTAVFPLGEHGSREERDRAMAEWLAGHGVRLVVCAGYMQLLTPGFLDRFPAMNVHPSLLPAFPGLRAVEE